MFRVVVLVGLGLLCVSLDVALAQSLKVRKGARTDWHHIFDLYRWKGTSAWRKAMTVAEYHRICIRKIRYRTFLKLVLGNDFDPNDYTVLVDRSGHRKLTRKMQREMQDFMDECYDELCQALKKGDRNKVRELGGRTIDKALEIADKNGADLTEMRRYRSERRTLNSLLKKHKELVPDLHARKHKIWQKVAKKGVAKWGHRFAKCVPQLRQLVTAAAIVRNIDRWKEDPEVIIDDLAESYNVDKVMVKAWLAGKASAGLIFIPPEGTRMGSTYLADGMWIHIDQTLTYWGWAPDGSRNCPEWVKEVKIVGIWSSGKAGTATIHVRPTDGSGGQVIKLSQLSGLSEVPAGIAGD